MGHSSVTGDCSLQSSTGALRGRLLYFFFNLTYSRWASSLPSCLWSLRIFPSLPRFTPYDFLSRCMFSTLATRQPMVEFYLLTFPRFPLRKKEHKSYFGKNRTHDFRTSRCAGYYYTRPLGRRESILYSGYTITTSIEHRRVLKCYHPLILIII